MEKSYTKLLENNQNWALERKAADPEYFRRLATGQSPEYLWIGCSDSRVPVSEVTRTQPGEIFVHRNIANVVIQTDMNLLSVLYYAVDILEIKHVIICGHYGCGGVSAAMENTDYGFVNNWLRSIKEVYAKYREELEAIADLDVRERRLVELNTIEQARNLAKTRIAQRAWIKGELSIHPWIFDCSTGLIRQLTNIIKSVDVVDPVFRYKLEIDNLIPTNS
ncbi:MAG: carbonic anhydrase [Saprospiraceae bacterium]|jgi:carbonic anhydrase|nr:carbonic anhydrase [Saprospiraceae bacterium]MBP9209299.1 carbonic anhydrase [Saprospiraceae bacterium]